MMRGRCLVVGGHSRGVGKTALVVDLVRALRPDPVITVKVSAHRHGRDVVVDEDDVWVTTTSTGRCRAAGAARAFLCRCPDDGLAAAHAFIERLRADGANVIVESNRLAPWLAPDVAFFVVSAATADWKASSGACLAVADAVVRAPGTTAPPLRLQRYLDWRDRPMTVLAFSPEWRVPELSAWLERRPARAAFAV